MAQSMTLLNDLKIYNNDKHNRQITLIEAVFRNNNFRY